MKNVSTCSVFPTTIFSGVFKVFLRSTAYATQCMIRKSQAQAYLCVIVFSGTLFILLSPEMGIYRDNLSAMIYYRYRSK